MNESEIRDRTKALVDATSPRKAAVILGIGRSTVIALAGGLRVQRGTVLLVRERLRELEKEADATRGRQP